MTGTKDQYRWRSIAWPGLELVQITRDENAIAAEGMLITEADGKPYGAQYRLVLAPDWTLVRVAVSRQNGARRELISDGKGNWTDGNGLALPELAGAIDIDLSGSPLTNTLPIRRTRLQADKPQCFTMAFIDLESLTVAPHTQIYTRIDDTHFAYESETTGFTAKLTVDKDGFVTEYPGLFERIGD